MLKTCNEKLNNEDQQDRALVSDFER